MDDGLKKRLVGAVLLLSLGVIFLPVLFDRERMAPINHTSQIPEPPDIEPLTIELPQPLPEPAATEAFPISEAPAAEPVAEPEPARLTPSGDVRTYALQVASFRGQTMASELASKLAADGHEVFTRASRYDSGMLYRVLVGPSLSRTNLEHVKRKVDSKYKVDSLIIRYSPP